MRRITLRRVTLTAVLLLSCDLGDRPPMAPARPARPDTAPGTALVAARPLPRFLHWPLDALEAAPTGPYGAGTMVAITALMDHYSDPMQAAIQAGAGGLPRYGTNFRSGTRVVTVANIVAERLDTSEKNAWCGVAETSLSVATMLARLDIRYQGACYGSGGGNLAYNNHAGVDIRARFDATHTTQVFAPMDGWVRHDVVGPDGLAAGDLHALTICELPARPASPCGGWKVRLLHLSSWYDSNKNRALRVPDPGATDTIDCPPSECAQPGRRVRRGQLIGYSGNYLRGWGGVAPHLHIEVLDSRGIPRDPYGWESSAPDPMGSYTNGPLWIASPGTRTISVQPDGVDGRDVWITSAYSYGDDYGVDDAALQVGGWGDHYYTLLRFDLTGLPRAAKSATIVLQPFARGDRSTPVPMTVHRVLAAWDESTGWFTQPSATYVGDLPAPVPGTPFAIDVTALYNAWRSGASPNYGIQFRPTSTFNQFNVFRSSDYAADPTQRPKLVISY